MSKGKEAVCFELRTDLGREEGAHTIIDRVNKGRTGVRMLFGYSGSPQGGEGFQYGGTLKNTGESAEPDTEENGHLHVARALSAISQRVLQSIKGLLVYTLSHRENTRFDSTKPEGPLNQRIVPDRRNIRTFSPEELEIS